MSGPAEESVAASAALQVVANAYARIRGGEEPAGAIVDDAAAALPPAAAAVARACLTDALALRERATAATSAREALLASVAHDLRNPLNTLAMSAGLLREDIEREDIDVQRDLGLVHRMERGIDRMRRIVEDVLDASRIDAHKVDLVTRPEGAAQIAKEAIAAAAAALNERGATIVESGVDSGARVLVDRARAAQALAKSISLVLRSCTEGGQVQLSAVRDGDFVHFLVAAPLPGGASTARVDDGRGGLALLLARGIAELHGGSFDVRLADRVVVTLSLPSAP